MSWPSFGEVERSITTFHPTVMAFSISKALSNPATISTLRKHNVMYLDRGLIVLNKPSGLVMQGTTNVEKKVCHSKELSTSET